MQVTLHLSPEVSRELVLPANNTVSKPAEELMSVTKELGLRLVPMHPDSSDARLASTFSVDAADYEHAKVIVSRLKDLAAIDAVYIKPSPSPP